ncbi:MAG TPA: hypothetical protein VJH91_02425 [Candidatus Paceibacterota bacterium]
MNTTTLTGIVVVLVVLLGGWYWWSGANVGGQQCTQEAKMCPDGSSVGRTGPNCEFALCPGEVAPMSDGTSVGENLILGVSLDTTLGQYLSAYNGMTVYTTTKDTKGMSNCAGDCAVNWPPYTVASVGDINIPSAIDDSKVGSITRTDGKIQVTYNGMPLYFYKSDTKPGDTTGHNVGGVWFAVKP